MIKTFFRIMSIIALFALTLGSHSNAAASSATANMLVGSGIWISQSELMSRPVSGAAWQSILSHAGASWGSANVFDQNSNHDQYVLAGAFVCARTNQYCDKTRQGLLSAIGTEEGSRWLAIGRNMLGYTIAADVMRNSGNLTGADLDNISNWLASFLTRTLQNNNSSTQEVLTPFESGSNASAQEGAAYAAIAAYTNNTEKLNYVWNRFRLYSCDRAGNPEQKINIRNGFDGGWSFTTDYSQACAVNPKDATKNGVRIDGAVINDIVRGGSFQWPPVWTGYEWTGLQGYVPAALILSRAGYPSLQVKDRAVLRAADYVCFLENNTSSSWWEPSRAPAIKHLIKAVYGYNPAGCDISYPVGDGMTIGYTDWTHPAGVTSITPTAPATFTPTKTPTASSTPIFIPTLTSTMTATATNTPAANPTVPATIGSPTPTSPSATPVVVSTGQNTVEVRVVKGADDVEERSTGSMYIDSSDLELVYDTSNQVVGIRFVGVNVPKGATITNAYLQFKVDESSSSATTLSIQGEASSSALAFASTTLNVSMRLRTVNVVSWSPASWLALGAMGTDQRTPNLAPIIQEIIDQPGWVAGNSMVMIMTGSGKRVAESYEGDRAGAPLLHIEYNVAASMSMALSLPATTIPAGSPTALPTNTQTIVTLVPTSLPLTAIILATPTAMLLQAPTLIPSTSSVTASPTTSPTDIPSPVVPVQSIDSVVPTLSAIHIQSNNANPTLAKVGDTVMVSFTSSESITAPIVTIAGNAATVSGGPTSWSASYVMTDGNIEGPAAFEISSFTDAAGNPGSAVSFSTDASSVSFDKTAPTVSSVHIQSSNINPALAKVGDTITVSFTSSESITTPVVTVAGKAATVSGGPASWSASYVLADGNAEGVVAFDISSFNDAAGNPGSTASSSTDASSVTFDKTVPTLVAVHIQSSNASPTLAKVGDSVMVSFTSSESITAPIVTIAGNAAAVSGGPTDWSASYVMADSNIEGPIAFEISPFNDAASNPGSAVSSSTDASSVTFDKTAPTLAAVHIQSSNANPTLAKVGDTVTVSFTGSETTTAPSVVTIAGNVATVSGGPTDWSASYVMTDGNTEGPVAFEISSFTDAASNPGSAVSFSTDASSVSFDKTAPTASSVHIQSSNANPTLAKVGDTLIVSFTSSESIMAPIVTIAGNAATVSGGPTDWSASYVLADGNVEGLVIFDISSFNDAAGNPGGGVSSTTDASSVAFDKTAPIVSSVHIQSSNVSPTLAKVGDTITVSFTSSESITAPIVTIAGNAATVSGGPASWSASYVLADGNAEGVVAFDISSFNDAAGNPGSTASSSTDTSGVTFDKTAPSLSVVHIQSSNANPTHAKVGDTITISFTASESITAPIVTIAGNAATVSGGPTSWSATYVIADGDINKGPVIFTISFFNDPAGNPGNAVSSSTDASSVTIHKGAPTETPAVSPQTP